MMNNAFKWILGLALIVTVLIPNSVLAENDSIDLSYQIEQREKFGLKHDDEHLNDVNNHNPIVEETINEWGFPLSVEELEEMKRRDKIVDEVHPIIRDYFNTPSLRSIYGGHYLDQPSGGEVVIMIKRDSNFKTTIQNQLQSLIDENSQIDKLVIRYKEVKYSLEELEKAADKIFEERDKISFSKDNFTAVSIQPINNTVLLTVRDKGNINYSKLKEIINDLDIITIDEGQNDQDRGVWRGYLEGGQKITNTRTTLYCTSAFIGKRSSTYYLITAAHCAIPGDSYKVGSQTIGYVTSNAYHYGNTVDALGIVISNNSWVTPYFYYENSSKGRVFKGYQIPGDEMIGQTVGLSGATSGTQRGTLVSTSTRQALDDGTVLFLREATYKRGPGDSGGTIFRNNDIVGVHSGHIGETRAL